MPGLPDWALWCVHQKLTQVCSAPERAKAPAITRTALRPPLPLLGFLTPKSDPSTELMCLVCTTWLCAFVSLSKCPNVSPKCVHALPFQLQGKLLRERANLLLLLPLLLLLLTILCSLPLCYSATMSWLPIKASSPWRKQLFPSYFGCMIDIVLQSAECTYAWVPS